MQFIKDIKLTRGFGGFPQQNGVFVARCFYRLQKACVGYNLIFIVACETSVMIIHFDKGDFYQLAGVEWRILECYCGNMFSKWFEIA